MARSQTVQERDGGVTGAVGLDQQMISGYELAEQGRFDEAEVWYRRVIATRPDQASAHDGLGHAREMQNDLDGAVAHYREALQLDPHLSSARRRLGILLARLGRRDESLSLWHAESLASGTPWMNELLVTTLRRGDLALAAEYAAMLAALRWGSQWYPKPHDGWSMPVPAAPPDASLTVPKLRHDLEQFLYLQRIGALGAEFTPIVADYQRAIDQLMPLDMNARIPLDDETRQAIGHVYNRIVHVRHTPRVQRALSGKWDPTPVESEYLDKPPGLVVVDDFLTDEALESLRLFCLESTVWSSHRHAYGRLGSQFQNGFNCPLLIQIAEEIRDVFPRLIGNRYPLRHIWGYKSGPTLAEGSTIHADFAAVNVNFWVTPDDANLDKTSGGLIVYAVDAPLHWDWVTYNARRDVIKPYLNRQEARAVSIPYRQNRAVIFNSDLFHETANLHFRPGYENLRVNVTMLYGDRERDVDHRGLGRPDPLGEPKPTTKMDAWRSAAFSSARWRRR